MLRMRELVLAGAVALGLAAPAMAGDLEAAGAKLVLRGSVRHL